MRDFPFLDILISCTFFTPLHFCSERRKKLGKNVLIRFCCDALSVSVAFMKKMTLSVNIVQMNDRCNRITKKKTVTGSLLMNVLHTKD